MAEKEDYIVISKKDFDYKKGHYVTHLATQISREEAINRMAKALRSNIVETQAQCSCLNMAEAALNALLEGK